MEIINNDENIFCLHFSGLKHKNPVYDEVKTHCCCGACLNHCIHRPKNKHSSDTPKEGDQPLQYVYAALVMASFIQQISTVFCRVECAPVCNVHHMSGPNFQKERYCFNF